MTQEWSVIAHLKGLPIPVLDLLNRRHATHVVREFIKFLGSMRQSDGEFFYFRQGTIKNRREHRRKDCIDARTEQELTSP